MGDKICEGTIKKVVMRARLKFFVVCLGIVLVLAGCGKKEQAVPTPVTAEVSVQEIPLDWPVQEERLALLEISGLAWYGDILILLPQYPADFEDRIFFLSRSEILDFLNRGVQKDGSGSALLRPMPLKLEAPGLPEKIAAYRDLKLKFEGFEAIAFLGKRAFLTVEASVPNTNKMRGFLISGTMEANLSGLTLHPERLTEIPPQASVKNAADETLLIVDNQLVTIYEGNGKNINPFPRAHIFDLDLQLIQAIPLSTIEYRITDATGADAGRRFWCINYYYPGEREEYKPAEDEITAAYGRGASHHAATEERVERLVEFVYCDTEIRRVESPPIQLALNLSESPRNWEGIVRLDKRGFLLVTDEHPRTILAFVAGGRPCQ